MQRKNIWTDKCKYINKSYNPLVFSLNFISNFLAIIKNVTITNFMKKNIFQISDDALRIDS